MKIRNLEVLQGYRVTLLSAEKLEEALLSDVSVQKALQEMRTGEKSTDIEVEVRITATGSRKPDEENWREYQE